MLTQKKILIIKSALKTQLFNNNKKRVSLVMDSADRVPV